MSKKAATTWDRLDDAMSHFQAHIADKQRHGKRLSLSMVDLLHVSNFKGGNASITEPVASLAAKLAPYQALLHRIDEAFGSRPLSGLQPGELETLQQICGQFMALAKAEATHIRGFGESYASALLAAHFLDLCPVLDKWALRGAKIPGVEFGFGDNVKEIGRHYPALIQAFHAALQAAPGTTLRQQDRTWFIQRPESDAS